MPRLDQDPDLLLAIELSRSLFVRSPSILAPSIASSMVHIKSKHIRPQVTHDDDQAEVNICNSESCKVQGMGGKEDDHTDSHLPELLQVRTS